MRRVRESYSFFSLCLLSALAASSAVNPVFAGEPTYWQDVRPVLRKHCIACHSKRTVNEVEVSGKLALDSYESFMKVRPKKVVLPGKGGASVLIHRVTSKDEATRMPPGREPLPAEVVALLRRWIDSGAAEGKRPNDAPIVVTRPPRRRKLPVRLLTEAVPPPGVLGNGKPDKLQLMLQAGPLAPVTAVAFSPNGGRGGETPPLLATGSYGQVSVWDLAAVKPAKVITSVLGSVNDLRFSPDGKLLAVAGGQPSARGDLRLFQTSDWKLVATLQGHEDVVASVAFSPDGKRLASASFDKTVRVWDVATHKPALTLTGHSDFVYAVAFSRDGKWLASASKDRTVKLIDAATGDSRFTFSGMNEDVLAVDFSGDGKHVVSSGYESGLYWWNTATGKRERLQRGHGTAVHELCFSDDGKLLASAGGDATLRLWDGVIGAPLRTLRTGALTYAVALGPDGRLAASGSFDGLVRLWDVKTGRHLLTLLTLPSQGETDWLALTPEGYAAGSKAVMESGAWRMAGKPVPAAAVWKTLGKADAVVRAAHGEKLPVPVFQK